MSTSCLNTGVNPKFLACCVLSKNMPQFDFREFPHLPLEMNTSNLNGPTSRNLNGFKSYECEGQAIGLPVPVLTRKLLIQVPMGIETEMCRITIMYEMQLLTNDQ
jgi:hypothetical protein